MDSIFIPGLLCFVLFISSRTRVVDAGICAPGRTGTRKPRRRKKKRKKQEEKSVEGKVDEARTGRDFERVLAVFI